MLNTVVDVSVGALKSFQAVGSMVGYVRITEYDSTNTTKAIDADKCLGHDEG